MPALRQEAREEVSIGGNRYGEFGVPWHSGAGQYKALRHGCPQAHGRRGDAGHIRAGPVFAERGATEHTAQRAMAEVGRSGAGMSSRREVLDSIA